jgi:hypothetical protein
MIKTIYSIFFQSIEEGVSHMWTVSAIQMHAKATIICDEASTAELKVKTVKYYKDLWEVHVDLNKEVDVASSVYTEVKESPTKSPLK